MRFFGYVVSTKEVQIKKKQIEAIKNWPKPKSVRDIQMFVGFANFYYQFIYGFNKIVTLLILMLEISGIEVLPKKEDNIESNKGAIDDNYMTIERSDGASDKNFISTSSFLTFGTTIAFAQLRKTFIRVPILHYFELNWYIWIKTDTFGYAIGGVFSQLTSKTG